MSDLSQQYTGRLYTQAEVDRMVREARLSELEELKGCGYYPFYSDEAEKYTERRIDEVKKELETEMSNPTDTNQALTIRGVIK